MVSAAAAAAAAAGTATVMVVGAAAGAAASRVPNKATTPFEWTRPQKSGRPFV